MFQRLLLWLGLIAGGLVAFKSLTRPRTSLPPEAVFVPTAAGDALICCDSAGFVLKSNDAAVELFGLNCEGYHALCYSNGQAVPPGQLPLARVLRTQSNTTNAEYVFRRSGRVRTLDVTAQPVPGGGAAALFRDVTALHESRMREEQGQARHQALLRLTRRLSKACSAQEIGRAVTEAVYSLLTNRPDADRPDIEVRLYSYDRPSQTLFQLASEPARPKRPVPVSFPFDAVDPALWQLYLDRQPSVLTPGALEQPALHTLALPLLSGGLAVGHLSLACSEEAAFDDFDLRQTLEAAASLAALALAGPQSSAASAASDLQVEAVREIAAAIGSGAEHGQLADLTSSSVRRVLGAECTVSLTAAGKTPARSEAKATRKAWRTQKIAASVGLPGETGQKGQRLMTAVPITPQRGVLTVCTDGALPLTDAQIKFLNTLAALLSAGLRPATGTEALADV